VKIELLGWKSEGLRSPDVEINLIKGSDQVPSVCLIQMPNGTGKTTTLSCLRASMDGSAERWQKNQVLEFQDLERKPDKGCFLTTLRIDGTKRLIIEMTFDFEIGCVTYRTTYGSRNETGYTLPKDVARYLDPIFSELLFFNGELANNLIDGSANVDASKIIDTYYGLYHISELKKQAASSYEAFIKNRKAPGRAAQLNRLDNNLTKWRHSLSALQTQLERNQAKKKELEKEISKLQADNEQHLLQSKEFEQQEKTALANRVAAESNRQTQLLAISNQFPNPVFLDDPLRSELLALSEHLDTLKLPGPTSRIFFDELVKQTLCICNREMTDEARQAIQERSQQILGGNVTGFLNAFKQAVASLCNSPAEPSFDALLQNYKAAQEDVMVANSHLEDIIQKAQAAGDEEVKRRQQEIEIKTTTVNQLAEEIEEAERNERTGDSDSCKCVQFYRNKIREGEKQQAELSDSLDRLRRTEALSAILDEAYSEAHSALKATVIQTANERLRNVLKFNLIQIESIDNAVRLKGQAQGSVGQNLSVGYVFLAGLLHGGGNQFPMVVDSPAGSLDDVVRKEVATLLPTLIKQLVAFVIASERQWFVPALESAANEDVLFLTHLRLNEYTNGIIPMLGGVELNRTDNGLVLEGKAAFFNLGTDVTDIAS
jgi:DNA sulfur modification protein DndD